MAAGKPVTFQNFLDIYKDWRVALRRMRETCLKGEDEGYANSVCAAYLDWLEMFILKNKIFCGSECISDAWRAPWESLVGFADPDVYKIVERAWNELKSEYGIKEVTKGDYTYYVLDDLDEHESAAIVVDKFWDVVNEIEELYLRKLGPGRYVDVYTIRRRARKVLTGTPLPSPPSTVKIEEEEEEEAEERERREAEMRLEEIEVRLERIRKQKERLERIESELLKLKREIEEKIRKRMDELSGSGS